MASVTKVILGRLFGAPFDVEMPVGAEVLGLRLERPNFVLDVLADDPGDTETWTVALIGPGQSIDPMPASRIEGASIDGGRRVYAVRMADASRAGRGPISAPPGQISPP